MTLAYRNRVIATRDVQIRHPLSVSSDRHRVDVADPDDA